ncbi:biotin-dependent carboxyltransferase family protein [Cobetia amphilecti]|uniref:5-oxoprolinase subunit C family protein n=1 Tax=Cobetia amphilecti TaxID=1055104 RepID=UPI00244A882D|nr:biotin-dependent carboxyltransferase family protein [Cobetia litoralis]MDH2421442.1 biotin-dependent carboxyltransferase family protein [Cobetia litoralis]
MSDVKTKTTLRVERSGALALVQDAGRLGVRHLGVTQGGAADWVSLGWANWLLGNAHDAPGLEITMGGGLLLKVEQAGTLALCGADLAATLDGEALAPGQAFEVTSGQQLKFERPVAGLRAYLAFPGGLDVAPVLGSAASTVRDGLGGLDGEGRALASGDVLTAASNELSLRELPASAQAWQQSLAAKEGEALELPLVVGAQIAEFSGDSLYRAFNSEWAVDGRADRMGVRLIGPRLERDGAGMVSEGIPLGAVQVPADGQPIILLNDRQTIGGYPRLGALTPLACAQLGQCVPGTRVRLAAVTPGQARRDHLEVLAGWQS